jgi:GntR family transcriptional regulator/MocR family aminotransferase
MMVDRQGDPAMEAAIAEFIEAGELHRHTRKMMRLYSERRERFAELLPQTFGDDIAFSVPDGGLAFWVRFKGVDLDRFLECAHARRLHFQSPRPFVSTNGAQSGAQNGVALDALRLGFAGLDLGELEAATERLSAAHQDAVG